MVQLGWVDLDMFHREASTCILTVADSSCTSRSIFDDLAYALLLAECFVCYGVAGSSSFAGLDLNRPAFEDDDEFLEMEKDALETDVDEFMEDQPSHTRLPMRTSEDLKPMKLLGNFRA